MNKYNVGDVVKFTDTNGGYDDIENHGEIMEVNTNKNGYYIRVHNVSDCTACMILFFYEDEIAGKKE